MKNIRLGEGREIMSNHSKMAFLTRIRTLEEMVLNLCNLLKTGFNRDIVTNMMRILSNAIKSTFLGEISLVIKMISQIPMIDYLIRIHNLSQDQIIGQKWRARSKKLKGIFTTKCMDVDGILMWWSLMMQANLKKCRPIR